MSEVAIQPLQWLTLDDSSDVRPIGGSDAACLIEVREVLGRHGYVDRFGITLLHDEFEMGEDELLLETTNIADREHWVRPVKKADLVARGLKPQTTMVRFDKSGYSQVCFCAIDKDRHTGHHK